MEIFELEAPPGGFLELSGFCASDSTHWDLYVIHFLGMFVWLYFDCISILISFYYLKIFLSRSVNKKTVLMSANAFQMQGEYHFTNARLSKQEHFVTINPTKFILISNISPWNLDLLFKKKIFNLRSSARSFWPRIFPSCGHFVSDTSMHKDGIQIWLHRWTSLASVSQVTEAVATLQKNRLGQQELVAP